MCISGGDNGIDQPLTKPTSGYPSHARATAWVYVYTGRVGVGARDGGNSGMTTGSTTHNQWEELTTDSTGAVRGRLTRARRDGGAEKIAVAQAAVFPPTPRRSASPRRRWRRCTS